MHLGRSSARLTNRLLGAKADSPGFQYLQRGVPGSRFRVFIAGSPFAQEAPNHRIVRMFSIEIFEQRNQESDLAPVWSICAPWLNGRQSVDLSSD